MKFRISIVDSQNKEVVQKQTLNIGYPTHAANFKKSSYLPITENETVIEERSQRYRSKINKEETWFHTEMSAWKADCASVVNYLQMKGRSVFQGLDESKYKGITGLLYLNDHRNLEEEAVAQESSLGRTCMQKLTAKELTLITDGRINGKLKRPSDSRLKRLKRRQNNLELKDIDKAISRYKIVIETLGAEPILKKREDQDDTSVRRKRYKSASRRKTVDADEEQWTLVEETYITDVNDVFHVDHNVPREKLFLMERWTSTGNEDQWCNVRRIIICILVKLTHRPNTEYHNQISISMPCLDTYDLVLNGNRIFHPHTEMNKIYPYIEGSRFIPLERKNKKMRHAQLDTITEDNKGESQDVKDSFGKRKDTMGKDEKLMTESSGPLIGKRRKRRKTVIAERDLELPSICEEDWRDLNF